MLKTFSTYAIIQTSDLANTEFVIKWNSTPTFISDGSVLPVSELTHAEALAVMATAEWSEEIPVE